MKRFWKILGVMLAAMWAMSLMATSAFALPDISITLGSYPLHLNYLSNTVITKLESSPLARCSTAKVCTCYI